MLLIILGIRKGLWRVRTVAQHMVFHFFFKGVDTPDTRSPNDTGPLFVYFFQVQSGSLMASAAEAIANWVKRSTRRTSRLSIKSAGSKSFDLAGKAGFEQSSIELGDGTGPADPFLQPFQVSGYSVADGGNSANAGDDDSFHEFNFV